MTQLKKKKKNTNRYLSRTSRKILKQMYHLYYLLIHAIFANTDIEAFAAHRAEYNGGHQSSLMRMKDVTAAFLAQSKEENNDGGGRN